MTIAQDILKNEVPAFIELFDIDLSSTNEAELVNSILRFTPMTDSTDLTNLHNVMFGNNTYYPFPIQISGISFSSDGAPPRPQITIANIDKSIGEYVFRYGDIIGTTVIYTRTFSTYLNTANKISLPPLKYFVAKKLSHNKNMISFELRDFRDKERAMLPRRQMLKKDFPGLGINKYVR